MKTRKWSFISIIVFTAFLFLNCGFVKAENSYDNMKPRLNVYSKKVWKIKFNNKLDPSTVNGDNIMVLDKNSKKASVEVAVGSDGKSIEVIPRHPYNYNETYTLIIKDKVKSVTSTKLINSTKMEFTVKDKLKENKDYTVAIDAAYGGGDSGKVSPLGLNEKSINLSVALKVGKILKDNQVNVVYTRSSDETKDIQSRFNTINNSKADYLVSINCNYYNKQDIKGSETYYSAWDDISKKLAENIQNELINKTKFINRGIKQATVEHEIIRGSNAHGVMVYLGFISNIDESIFMGSNEFQQKSAEAIAQGILKSLNLTDKSKIPPTIKSVSNVNMSINKGQEYSLPVSVKANMSDGSVRDVGVIWDSNELNTYVPGTYTYKGSIVGYDKKITLVVTVLGTSFNDNMVCIDPGHGMGKDTGAFGCGIQEDDVTLKVALKVGKILEDRGVSVVYTRKTDMSSTPMSVNDSLQKRCNISNNARARYFVSIHCNSFESSTANGTETLYFTESAESKRLAQSIQSNIIKEVGTYNRGLKSGNWLYIVKNANATTVLTELGFLTNPSDAEKLKNESYLDKYAKAIANGILQNL